MLSLLLGVCCGPPSKADTEPPPAYRFFFDPASARLIEEGPLGKANAQAIEDTVAIMTQWAAMTALQFHLAGDRKAFCEGAAGCDPNPLLLDRKRTVWLKIYNRAETVGASLHPGGVNENFWEKLYDLTPQMAPQEIGSVLDLAVGINPQPKAHFKAEKTAAPPAKACPWRVFYRPGRFPHTIDAGMFLAEANAVLPGAINGEIRLDFENGADSRQLIAFWQNYEGGARAALREPVSPAAGFAALSAKARTAPIPEGAAKLHLIAVSAAEKNLLEFARALSPERFEPVSAWPNFIDGRLPIAGDFADMPSGVRAARDMIRSVPGKGGVVPDDALYCTFFTGAAPQASRIERR